MGRALVWDRDGKENGGLEKVSGVSVLGNTHLYHNIC